jgi:hypothetical protein
MKKYFLLLIMLVFVVASCNLNPTVDYLRVCNNPDYDKTCPDDNSVLNASETDTIYMTATLSHIPENTEVTITWYYLENEEMIINKITLRTDEDMVDTPVYSYLPEPSNGWPLGKYKVKIDLKLEKFKSVEKQFSLE